MWTDASPQGVLDITNSVIVRVRGFRSVGTSAAGMWPSADTERLRLPLSVIGFGNQKFVDKLYCVLHQLWLEFGPGAASLHRLCTEVHAFVADMGT